jgi:hypothetical protein
LQLQLLEHWPGLFVRLLELLLVQLLGLLLTLDALLYLLSPECLIEKVFG